MTIVCQPIDASGGLPAYTAQASRQAFSSLMGNGTNRPLGAISGIRPGQGGETSILGSTVTVQPFSAIIDAAFTTAQAPYQLASNAAESRAVTAANATLARIDILYIQVSDTVIDSSGGRAGALLYLAGTAAGSPTKPALPARSVEYAVITVPASGGGAATVVRTIGYAVASGGILPVASSAQYPAVPYVGQMVDDAALGYPVRWSGAVWAALTPLFNRSWVSVGAGGGAPGFQNGWSNYLSGQQAVQFSKIDDVVTVRGLAKGGTINSAPATGSIFTLPVGYRPSANRIFSTSGATAASSCDIKTDGAVVASVGSNTYYSVEFAFAI